jgi:hypothetical protein
MILAIGGPMGVTSGRPIEDVSLFRFSHRGHSTRPEDGAIGRMRLVFRYPLSPLFPRLHDAVRGLATLEPGTRRIAILDVPRDYEFPVRAVLRHDGHEQRVSGLAVLNKNGLLALLPEGSRHRPPFVND